MSLVSAQQISDFARNGAVVLPGLFTDWVETLAKGIQTNMDTPGTYAAENLKQGDTGRFFDDYCNWQRILEFGDFAKNSRAGEAAAALMGSSRVQLFHDHVLVKEPGTSKATPWHQDSPYYFVEGEQTLSFWIPLDPVDVASLRIVAGSHKWPKPVMPTRWLNEDKFYADESAYIPVPDPDAEDDMKVVEWTMKPGDAVAFHYKALHGARANMSPTRRRAFSLRVLGDDARYVTRPGSTSPPFPGHDMTEGQILREDWFPFIHG